MASGCLRRICPARCFSAPAAQKYERVAADSGGFGQAQAAPDEVRSAELTPSKPKSYNGEKQSLAGDISQRFHPDVAEEPRLFDTPCLLFFAGFVVVMFFVGYAMGMGKLARSYYYPPPKHIVTIVGGGFTVKKGAGSSTSYNGQLRLHDGLTYTLTDYVVLNQTKYVVTKDDHISDTELALSHGGTQVERIIKNWWTQFEFKIVAYTDFEAELEFKCSRFTRTDLMPNFDKTLWENLEAAILHVPFGVVVNTTGSVKKLLTEHVHRAIVQRMVEKALLPTTMTTPLLFLNQELTEPHAAAGTQAPGAAHVPDDGPNAADDRFSTEHGDEGTDADVPSAPVCGVCGNVPSSGAAWNIGVHAADGNTVTAPLVLGEASRTDAYDGVSASEVEASEQLVSLGYNNRLRNVQLIEVYKGGSSDMAQVGHTVMAALLSGEQAYGEEETACVGCATFSAAFASRVRGKVLLLEGGDNVCSFVERVAYAQAAGAAAVVFVGSTKGGDPDVIVPSEYETAVIDPVPALIVDAPFGSRVRAALKAGKDLKFRQNITATIYLGADAVIMRHGLTLNGEGGTMTAGAGANLNINDVPPPDLISFDELVWATVQPRFGLFPAAPVHVGDSWSQDYYMETPVPHNVHDEYRMMSANAISIMLDVNLYQSPSTPAYGLMGERHPSAMAGGLGYGDKLRRDTKLTGHTSGTYHVSSKSGVLLDGKTTSRRRKMWDEHTGTGKEVLHYRYEEHASATMRSSEGYCKDASDGCTPAPPSSLRR